MGDERLKMLTNRLTPLKFRPSASVRDQARRRRFYLLSGAVVVILIGLWWGGSALINRESQNAQTTLLNADRTALTRFLAKQTDANKLITLAKNINASQPSLVEPILDRAEAVSPTNATAVYLDSFYHPNLKLLALQLNPLLGQTINPNAPLGQIK